MKTFPLLSLAFSLLFLLAGCSPRYAPSTTPAPSAEDAYNGYRRAVLDGEGAKAAGFVDRATLEYYDGLRESALEDDSLKLSQRGVLEQYLVLRLRTSVADDDELEAFSSREFFAFAVDTGLIGERSVASLQLDSIREEGNTAYAYVRSRGVAAEQPIRLVREGDDWRIDLTGLVAAGESVMTQMAAAAGISGSQFVTNMLANLLNTPPDPEWWKPLDD